MAQAELLSQILQMDIDNPNDDTDSERSAMAISSSEEDSSSHDSGSELSFISVE